MEATENPHEVLYQRVCERIGRVVKIFEAEQPQLLQSIVKGLMDQLSIYADMVPGAALTMAGARWRDGGDRKYLFIDFRDRGAGLRLRDATMRWDFDPGYFIQDFVNVHNARRWRFIERYASSLVVPMFARIASLLSEYEARTYEGKMGRKPVSVGIARFLESIDRTTWCCEIDPPALDMDRDTKDRASRWNVQ